MSDQELNKVDRDVLLQAAQDRGLTVTEQSAYAKLTFGDSPAKLYIARTQNVSRVDLSGFTIECDGVRQISREEAKELKRGKVQAELDFTQSEETILEAFGEACEALKLVAPRPKKVAKPKKEAAPAPEVEATTETPETPVEEPEDEIPTLGEETPEEVVEASAEPEPETTDFGSEFETTSEPPQEATA